MWSIFDHTCTLLYFNNLFVQRGSTSYSSMNSSCASKLITLVFLSVLFILLWHWHSLFYTWWFNIWDYFSYLQTTIQTFLQEKHLSSHLSWQNLMTASALYRAKVRHSIGLKCPLLIELYSIEIHQFFFIAVNQ